MGLGGPTMDYPQRNGLSRVGVMHGDGVKNIAEMSRAWKNGLRNAVPYSSGLRRQMTISEIMASNSLSLCQIKKCCYLMGWSHTDETSFLTRQRTDSSQF